MTIAATSSKNYHPPVPRRDERTASPPNPGARDCEAPPIMLEGLPGRAAVGVSGVVVSEVVAREGTVGALGFIDTGMCGSIGGGTVTTSGTTRQPALSSRTISRRSLRPEQSAAADDCEYNS